MSWVSLILALVKLADNLFSWAHDNEKIKEGEDRQIAKATAEMLKRSTTLKEIDLKYSKMTPEEINRALDGDFRD